MPITAPCIYIYTTTRGSICHVDTALLEQHTCSYVRKAMRNSWADDRRSRKSRSSPAAGTSSRGECMHAISSLSLEKNTATNRSSYLCFKPVTILLFVPQNDVVDAMEDGKGRPARSRSGLCTTARPRAAVYVIVTALLAAPNGMGGGGACAKTRKVRVYVRAHAVQFI